MHTTVLLSDGRKLEADIKPADWVRLERQYRLNVSDLSEWKVDANGDQVLDDKGDPIRIPSPAARTEHNYYIAFAALKRTGQIDSDFDAFLDLIEAEIDVSEEEVPLDSSANTSPQSQPDPVVTPTPSS